MRIGLYLDMAIGTAPESAESWGEQRTIIPRFHIGAPPDAWNEAGQDWGLAVYNPFALARSGYGIFRRILGAVMRHAGSIRIDHVLGLYRLFLVPAGKSPSDGAYLRLPVSALCDALALESSAKRCLIVGEDLGTVPPDFPALLAARNIMSCRLLIFAKDGERFLAPHEYPSNALVATGTHDLPPLLGYWSEVDLASRAQLGLFPDDATRQRAVDERVADRAAMTAALQEAGFSSADSASLVAAAYGFLARTPCRLLLVQMEDLALESNQVNIPGSGDDCPNWRRKLGRDIDDVFADPRATAVLDAIRRERPRDA
jgi:4-alpha-glucanotransferase